MLFSLVKANLADLPQVCSLPGQCAQIFRNDGFHAILHTAKEGKIMPRYSAEFIKDMPKSDLHLHLDGSLRLDILIVWQKAVRSR